MGKIIIIASILVLFFGTIDIGLAQKGNPQKGKMLFVKNCRTCHIQDGKAKPLYGGRRKQADWQAAFAKEKYMTYPCKETWQKLSTQDIQDILSYFMEEAADGVMPRGCG
jgi:mono/diheme cytochrome c family protein